MAESKRERRGHFRGKARPGRRVEVRYRVVDGGQFSDEQRAYTKNIGVGGANQLFTHLEKVGCRVPVPLHYGETYLLVAKIVASGTEPAQVFMRVCGPDEPVEREESGGWTVESPPYNSKLVFEHLEIHINSHARQTIDEIRLGLTWASVTAPWAGAAGGKKAKL